jgi:hypothetical protein
MINPKVTTLLIQKDAKFTLILGSGFHKQAIGENSILSSWEKLLKQQDNTIELTDCYPLDFEQLIIGRTKIQKISTEKASHKIEELVSEEICFDLKCVQQKALKFDKEKYPVGIFNPEYVSDIISLNFDSLALELCAEKAGVEITSLEPMPFSYKGKKLEGVFYYEVKFSNTQSIRFWFPHGSILDEAKITLGTRNYAMRLATIEKLRKYSKYKETEERKSGSSIIETSWYHQLTHNPVLILGADMSMSEWDIWFALVNRERNFAKGNTKDYKYPIFQMRQCESNNKVQSSWFKPLFIGLKFDQQWSELEKLMNKQKSNETE